MYHLLDQVFLLVFINKEFAVATANPLFFFAFLGSLPSRMQKKYMKCLKTKHASFLMLYHKFLEN